MRHLSFVSRMRQTMSVFYLHSMLSLEGQSFPHGVQASVQYGNMSDISNFKYMNTDFCTMSDIPSRLRYSTYYVCTDDYKSNNVERATHYPLGQIFE